MKRGKSKLRSLRHVILVGFVVSWLGAFVATHIPLEQLPAFGAGDKTLHLVGFFLLGAGFWLTMVAFGSARLHRVVVIVSVMTIYAALDEITQRLVKNRYPALDDWLADIVGAIVAVVALEAGRWLVIVSRRRVQSHRQ